MSKSRFFASAVALVGAILAHSPAVAQTAVKIGFIAPTKSLVGAQLLQGAQVAVDTINASGGVLGRKIQLIEYDTAFQPSEGVTAAQRLINQDGVKVIAGEISSTVALAVLQVARSAGVLYVAAVPKHPDVTKSGYDRLFRLNSTTAMDAEFNDVLKNEIRPQKVAVIAENSDFGQLTVASMKTLFGSKVVLGETYEMSQSDFSTLVTKTKAAGADLICIAGANMEQYGNILRSLQELKVPGRRCVMPGILNSKGVELAGPGAEDAFSADIYVASMPGNLNKKFVDSFRTRFGHAPEKIEVLGFESIWLVAQAMTKAGTADDAGKIGSTLRSNTWNTPRGDVKFDATGQASSGGLIRLVVKDGLLVPQRR